MSIPGFVADASLNSVPVAYRGESDGVAPAGGAVKPQVCVSSPCLRIPGIPIGVKIECCTKWSPPFVGCSFKTC